MASAKQVMAMTMHTDPTGSTSKGFLAMLACVPPAAWCAAASLASLTLPLMTPAAARSWSNLCACEPSETGMQNHTTAMAMTPIGTLTVR